MLPELFPIFILFVFLHMLVWSGTVEQIQGCIEGGRRSSLGLIPPTFGNPLNCFDPLVPLPPLNIEKIHFAPPGPKVCMYKQPLSFHVSMEVDITDCLLTLTDCITKSVLSLNGRVRQQFRRNLR